MSYDPNQPQQPDPNQQPPPPYGQPQPGQPQQPYEQPQWGQQPPPDYGQPGQPQQPPYGQPQWGQQPPPDYSPTQYVAPAYGTQPAPGYMPPQQPRRSRRGLWIALGIIGGVLVLSCAVCGILFATGVGFFAKTIAGPAIVVNQYYSAVEKQNYSTAYSYIGTNLTVQNGQTLTQELYTTAAQALDTVKGKVSNYSVGSVSVNNGIASVTVTVNRTNAQAYAVHLQLSQVNGTWKITSYDNI